MTKQKHIYNSQQKNNPTENPEDKKLVNWLQSSLNEKEDLSGHSLKKIFSRLIIREDDFSDHIQKEMWENISSECLPGKKSFFTFYKQILKYAAVLLLIVVPASFFYFNIQKTDYSAGAIDYQSLLQEVPDALTSSGNITIILPDKDTIEIKDDEADLFHDDKGEILVNGKENGDTKIVDTSAPQWLQLNVPYGKSTRITMSDGTKVWVNSGSRVLYPAHFTGNKRELYVEGEIYLEVAKNEQMPFSIRTDLMEVTVLGTSFNVNAYKNEIEQSVVLVSGKVRVKNSKQKGEKIILPNQKYAVDKETSTIQLEQVDVSEYTSWTQGYLSLKDEPLTQLIKRIERYYNIQVEHEPHKTQQILVSGKLDLKETPEELFEIISVTTPITYISNESKIKINVKPLNN